MKIILHERVEKSIQHILPVFAIFGGLFLAIILMNGDLSLCLVMETNCQQSNNNVLVRLIFFIPIIVIIIRVHLHLLILIVDTRQPYCLSILIYHHRLLFLRLLLPIPGLLRAPLLWRSGRTCRGCTLRGCT